MPPNRRLQRPHAAGHIAQFESGRVTRRQGRGCGAEAGGCLGEDGRHVDDGPGRRRRVMFHEGVGHDRLGGCAGTHSLALMVADQPDVVLGARLWARTVTVPVSTHPYPLDSVRWLGVSAGLVPYTLRTEAE